ncbi:hypothetical protein ABT373_33155 [Streptomyces sp. NPDC000070]
MPRAGTGWHATLHRRSEVAVGPDGSRLVTTGYDKTIRIWETSSGTPIES